jgi:hypothetical protein
MYTKHADGFYVRAKSNLCTPDITIKYISRYLGGPTIATSRIDKYDGEFVTFHCTRHDDNQTITECISALDFIKRQLYISLKSILKRYATMASMPSITSRKRNCINVSLMKRNDIFVRFLIGDIHSSFFWI